MKPNEYLKQCAEEFNGLFVNGC